MWSVFFIRTNSIEDFFFITTLWKKSIHEFLSIRVKTHFASKVTNYFDNGMILDKGHDPHINLLEAISRAEKEIPQATLLFPQIQMYWITGEEKNTHFISFYGIDQETIQATMPVDFKMISSDTELNNDLIKFKMNSWSTLVFDISTVHISSGWLNYVPLIDDRIHTQVENILFSIANKKKKMTVLEKIKFSKELKSHLKYKELQDKISKVMPKIQQSMEIEWANKKIKDKIKNKR